MLHLAQKKEVFQRYNRIILLAIFAAFVIALWFSYAQYTKQYERVIADKHDALVVQAEQFNSVFSSSVDALQGMQKSAKFQLASYQQPSLIENLQALNLVQNDEQYYLQLPNFNRLNQTQRLASAVSGEGNVKQMPTSIKAEIAMAQSLTPAFVATKNMSLANSWFYYTSKNKSVSVYPWRSHEYWRFSDELLYSEFAQNVFASTDPSQVFWQKSQPQLSGEKSTLSAAVPVINQQQTFGFLQVDFNLTSIQNMLEQGGTHSDIRVLVDKNMKVVAYASPGERVDASISSVNWQDAAPNELKSLSWQQLTNMSAYTEHEQWLILQQSIPINGWHLISLQPREQVAGPIFISVYVVFFSVCLSIFALLAVVYLVTNRYFVTPTRRFIEHIGHCSEGDHGAIEPAAGWQKWFQLVEDIFTQNRSLMFQLQEQNAVLDAKVIDKTKELQSRSLRHERDHALLRSVIHAIPELIIINDTQGQIVGCNQAFLAFMNCSETSLIGKKVSHILPSELAQEIQYQSEHFNQHNRAPTQATITPSNNNVYEVFCAQFFNERGQVYGSINIIRDVTARHNNQLALAQAKEQAEAANEAKGQFLANMSHEIRTPLNAIHGMVSLLENTQLNAVQKHYLENTNNASQSLLHLIDDLLDFSRIDSGKLTMSYSQCCLDKLVGDAIALNSLAAKSKNLIFEVNIAANVPLYIETDEMRLMQVLCNLINNAVKFTQDGKVCVDVLVNSNEQLMIEVIDTGIGIDKDKQAHLFDVFTQVDNSITREYGGSGLGLSICRQIINQLAGEITLESNLGEGCKFTIELPLRLSNVDEALTEFHAFDLLHCSYTFNASYRACADVLDVALISLNSNQNDWLTKGENSHEVEQLENIKRAIGAVSLSGREKVLLLESSCLTKESVCWLVDNWSTFEHLSLLALALPWQQTIELWLIEKLEQTQLPYVLLETPLYRLSLKQISAALSLPKSFAINSEESKPSLGSEVQKGIPEETKPLASLVILLVEDNEVNQLVAKELLESMGAKVTIAENGKQSLELIEQINFDLVLMDIQMPVMDGLTATKHIRAQKKFKNLPIVAMTAHVGEADINKSKEVGIDAHLGKPVTAKLLQDTILSFISNN